MRISRTVLAALGLSIAALGAGACNVDDSKTDDGKGQTPDFIDGQGQAPREKLDYAPGPYGLTVGSIIANYQFLGFPNGTVDSATLEPIQLAEFYNPTGDGVYPEGSPLGAGEPKPKALLIDVGSVWCGPCNQEAKTELPAKYAEFQPQGGEFLLQLADGATPGVAALPKALTTWVTKYKVNYPGAIDPSYKLGALFVQDAFPQNFIIDTRSMKIVKVIAGVPDATFWAKFQATIDSAQ